MREFAIIEDEELIDLEENARIVIKSIQQLDDGYMVTYEALPNGVDKVGEVL